MRASCVCLLLMVTVGLSQEKPRKPDDSPALTNYNQDFAVVRQALPLDVKAGTSQIEIADITAHLEPDSVILRDLKTGRDLRILEQNYRADVATQARLLFLYEGKTIDFLVTDKDNNRRLVPGKIIRSGYVTRHSASSPYYQQYYQAQQADAGGAAERLSRWLRSKANCNFLSPASLCFRCWPTIRFSNPLSPGY